MKIMNKIEMTLMIYIKKKMQLYLVQQNLSLRSAEIIAPLYPNAGAHA